MLKPKSHYDNQWDEKYARESWSFSFGSIMGAYGQNIKGKNISVTEMLEATKRIYQMSQKLIELSLEREPEKVGEGQSKQAREPEKEQEKIPTIGVDEPFIENKQ